jgi:putative ABC transport system permease protein
MIMKRFSFILKISLRNLFKNTRFAWVNIIGLSAGVTISILILLYIRYETSFDSFNPNTRNIFRIVTKNIQDGSVGASTPLPLSDVLKKDYPEIERVIGLMRVWEDIEIEDKKFGNLKGAIVEGEFFDFFSLPLQAGNKQNIFQDPFEAVVTRKLSKILFGNTDPLGKTFEFDKNIFTIKGIINDIPSNSILNFDFFLSDKFRYKYYPDLSERWYNFGLFTFITFKGNNMPAGFEKKLTGIEEKYYPDFMKKRNNFMVSDFKGSHLNPVLKNDLIPGIDPIYLWILAAIALGVLVIACLNFVNLSIANSGKRNIETVIKKLSGASPGGLVADFFAETALLVFMSLLVSVYCVYLLLPAFKSLIQQDIIVNLSDPVLWVGIAGFGVLTTLLSGLYPSIYLSRPSPVKVLLNNKLTNKNKLTFQKSFVVLQFVITIVLGITQLFIFKQISFLQNHATGFDKKNLVTIPVRALEENGNERLKKTTLFAQALEKQQSQFEYGKASITEFVPGFGFRNNFKIYTYEGKYTDGMELLSCDIDENFKDVFGLKIIKGRFFSKDFSTDKDALIINETAYKKLEWNSIDGKEVGLFAKEDRKQVIGVISDINVMSLQYPVEPMIYQFGRHHMYPGYITFRLNPDKRNETVQFIKDQWTGLFPGIPFSLESIDEKYKSAYGAEKRLAGITGVFSILAMVLSLLGMFALSTLEAERRIKEIGIRKINGSKVFEIIAMLNRDFLKWVTIAFVIACPVALYSLHKWLSGFAYKTVLSWWIFALVGFIALAIAFLTVSIQSWRAATRNPVEALRYE